MPLNKDIKKVLVIGSGPIVIGQAAEFDYSGTQACHPLTDFSKRTCPIVLNCKPDANISLSCSSLSAIPPPVPPSVYAGLTITG